MKIKLLVMDVDGTLTDGKIYMGEHGEVMKAFDIKDGYAIAHILPELGIIPVLITGRESKIVENRARELKITELHQGVTNKIDRLRRVMQKYGCAKENCAYFGDDLFDLPAMELCGVIGCPADAVDAVKQISHYVCKREAGKAAAREFIEWLAKEHCQSTNHPA